MSTLRTGVIAVTTPGFTPAEGFVEQALSNNPTCAGFVIHDGKKMFVCRVDSPDAGAINKAFTAFKGMRVNAFMGNYPSGYLAEDIQPFVLLGTDKDPKVAVMLDGDWVPAAGAAEGGNHSDEFFVAMNVLRPMFLQLERLTKGDVDAILEEVASDATHNSLMNTIINRGNIHLMFSNGKVHTVVKNELEKEFPWGWVSNHFMYSEDKKPEPVVVEEDDNPFNAVLAGKTVLPKIVPKAELPKVPATSMTVEGKKMVTCPRERRQPHKIEGWYKHNAGWVPQNYLEYPTVEVREKTPLASKDKVQELASAFKVADPKTTATRDPRVLPDVGSTKDQIAARTPPKATGPKIVAPVEPIKQPAIEPAPAVVVEPTKKDAASPAMSAEVQKEVITHFLKETEKMVHTTDPSGKPISDPKDALALTTKYTDFASRIGVPFEEIFRWKVERLELLVNVYPAAALHLLCDLLQKTGTMLKTQSIVQEPGKVTLPKINVRKTG